YFPAIAAIKLGFFAREGLDVAYELIFPNYKAFGRRCATARSISSPPVAHARSTCASSRSSRSYVDGSSASPLGMPPAIAGTPRKALSKLLMTTRMSSSLRLANGWACGGAKAAALVKAHLAEIVPSRRHRDPPPACATPSAHEASSRGARPCERSL